MKWAGDARTPLSAHADMAERMLSFRVNSFEVLLLAAWGGSLFLSPSLSRRFPRSLTLSLSVKRPHSNAEESEWENERAGAGYCEHGPFFHVTIRKLVLCAISIAHYTSTSTAIACFSKSFKVLKEAEKRNSNTISFQWMMGLWNVREKELKFVFDTEIQFRLRTVCNRNAQRIERVFFHAKFALTLADIECVVDEWMWFRISCGHRIKYEFFQIHIKLKHRSLRKLRRIKKNTWISIANEWCNCERKFRRTTEKHTQKWYERVRYSSSGSISGAE